MSPPSRPIVAGVVSGGIAAVVAALVSLPLRSPDEIVANSLSVAAAGLLAGLASGVSWRWLGGGDGGIRRHGIAAVLAFVASMAVVAAADQMLLSNLLGYALPLAAIIFAIAGTLTPIIAAGQVSWTSAAIAVVVAVAVGIGLFGRGNVASGELSLEDLDTTSTTSTTSPALGTGTTAPPTETTAAVAGTLIVPDDLATSYTATQGAATYEVPENLRGLDTVAVGRSDTLTGTVVPGGAFELTVDLTTFVSDQDRRDERVADTFAADPIATFSGPSFALPPAVSVGEVILLQVVGVLTINGVSREVTWSLEVQVRDDGIAVAGETDIAISDFGVTPPRAPGITVEDSAHLEVLFLAVPA